MAEKKYLGVDALIRLVAQLKAGYAALTHKHTLSDIEDYTVDSSLSTTSSNPIQNSTVATALNTKVPTSRTINGKALNEDITLNAANVGADSAGSASNALTSAKSYTDEQITSIKEGDITVANATHAVSATNATNATNADHADTADDAAHADEADYATFAGNANTAGSAGSATKATQDSLGNVINTTYETKADATAKLEAAKDYTDGAIGNLGNTYYTEKEIDSKVDTINTAINGKAASNHGHTIDKITGLQTELDTINGTLENKVNTSTFDSHTADTNTHVDSTEKSNWDAAYTHSQTAHAPAGAEVNQNAFSNVKVGDTTIAADTKTDTLTLAAGTNIVLTPDATNDKVTINNTYSYTLPVATPSVLGGVKSGTDITVDSSGNVTVNDDSHAHIIGNVDGLQSALDGKVPTSRTINGQKLTGNITLDADDVGAATVAYVDAAEESAVDRVLGYLANEEVNTSFDTLKEVADWIESDTTASAQLVTRVTNAESTLSSHTANKSNPHGVTAAQVGAPTTAAFNSLSETVDGSIKGLSVSGRDITYTKNDGTTGKIKTQDNNTLNTAGSTDTSSKIFLVGTTSQTSSAQTYSHDTAYVGTDGCLYSNGQKVSVNGHTHVVKDITDLSATAAELNVLDGITATTTELNYMDGVTSKVQTQLDAKASTSSLNTHINNTTPHVSTTERTNWNTAYTFSQSPISNEFIDGLFEGLI